MTRPGNDSNEEEGPLLPTVVDVMADLVGKAPEADYDSSGSWV